MDLLQQLNNMSDEEFVKVAMECAPKDMNRQQKRQMQREITDEAKTLKSLTSKQRQFMHRYANAKAREKSEDQVMKYITMVDTCLTSYFYLRYEDMTPDEAMNETSMISEMVIEYRDMLNDLIRECGGSEEMAAKTLEKVAREVQVKCFELINEGKNQKEALEILQFDFPKVNKSLLVNTYKHTKAKLKAEVAEKEVTVSEVQAEEKAQEEKAVEAAVEYIFEDEPKKKSKKAPEKEVEQKEEIKEQVKEEVKMPRLKVKSKKVVAEVTGEFGDYLFEDGVVTVGNQKFTSLVDVDEFEKSELRKLLKRIDELKTVMGGEF